MPIATISNNTLVVVPSTAEVTYSYLDLCKLVIRERAGNFSLHCLFLPSDGVNMLDEDAASEHALKLNLSNFGQFLQDRKDTALKLAAKAFIKELAAVAQEEVSDAVPIP